MQNTLTDKVIIISGGSSGIGLGLAKELLAKGCSVAVGARHFEKMETAYYDFKDSDRLFMKTLDVSVQAQCDDFVSAVVAQWGRVDWLINNAGMSMRALFQDLDVSVIESLMDINFRGTVYMTKAALPAILKTKGGVVGITSIAGYRGLPGRTGYSASKFAMQGFLECLRTELLYTGVHVMWAAPGFTSSNIRKTAFTASGDAQGETPLEESKLMSAEECASIIIEGMEKRKRTIIMTGMGKLTVWLNKLFPALMDRIVFKHFAKEADSPLQLPKK